ncbi:class II aldolase/adducin family protein [Promicromonospora sp. NPDC057488]|uniref:class II aldolase/adducin family protein n=1 Tax=Promicromonospora sp. NPDC057488 TaxID=3346147 RepID=UPI00366C10E5
MGARTQDDVETRRHAVRRDLAATLRYLGHHGYQYGLAGHATVRDPGEDERYWVNPAGVPFAAVRPADLVLVDAAGEIVAGDHGVSGFQSQLEVHRARPDLLAGLHVHSEHTFAWSSAGGLLDPLTTDSAWLQPVQTLRESFDQPITEAIGRTARVVIQRSHGAVTFGATVAEAAFYLVSVERAARTQLLLEAAGRAQRIDPALLEKWRLTPEAAHRQFQGVLDHWVAGTEK